MRIPLAKGMEVTANATRNARTNNPVLIRGSSLKVTMSTSREQTPDKTYRNVAQSLPDAQKPLSEKTTSQALLAAWSFVHLVIESV